MLKLERALDALSEMFVMARTDAADPDETLNRVERFVDSGADAVLIDGISDIALIREVSRRVDRPVAFNQIAGGKSPPCTLSMLSDAGVSIAIYSTPALFAAQRAIDDAMRSMHDHDGRLPQPSDGSIGVGECTAILTENLGREVPLGPDAKKNSVCIPVVNERNF